ncbi:hypothetical protein [Escherichia coli]|uniref:hypothetical protein n=1 Tax=Escherichia coli TaxID=562 RepID=UPI001FCF1BCA|nr:hypothetical protein [Escherichia coli]
MTNIEKQEKIGHELFGPNWLTPVARMLEINESTIRRWLTGKASPSVTIANELELLGAIEKKYQEAIAFASADKISGNSIIILAVCRTKVSAPSEPY